MAPSSQRLEPPPKPGRFIPDDFSKLLKWYYKNGIPTLERLGFDLSNSKLDRCLVAHLAVRYIAINFIAEPSLSMFRRTIFDEIGFFDADLKQICDLEFMLRAGSKYDIAYIPERLCHFRVHANSVSSINQRDQAYVIWHLDPVILVWKKLYCKSYQEFRNTLSFFELIKLNFYFIVRSYEAAHLSMFSMENAMRFQAISEKYPEIAQAYNASVVTKFLFAVVKIKRSITEVWWTVRIWAGLFE